MIHKGFSLSYGSVVVLAKSGLHSIITAPGDPRPATYALSPFPAMPGVPSASWIWDGPGNTATCNMNITVEEVFTVKCLNMPMTIRILADNYYAVTVLNTTAEGNYPGFKSNTLPTVGAACSKLFIH
jgi:hypothetical protein